MAAKPFCLIKASRPYLQELWQAKLDGKAIFYGGVICLFIAHYGPDES